MSTHLLISPLVSACCSPYHMHSAAELAAAGGGDHNLTPREPSSAWQATTGTIHSRDSCATICSAGMASTSVFYECMPSAEQHVNWCLVNSQRPLTGAAGRQHCSSSHTSFVHATVPASATGLRGSLHVKESHACRRCGTSSKRSGSTHMLSAFWFCLAAYRTTCIQLLRLLLLVVVIIA
jgi:hypothetical protein